MHIMSEKAHADLIWFKNAISNKELIEKLKHVTLIIADVDGTLTDTMIYVDGHGEGGRVFNIQDGYITTKAKAAGITVAFMSGKDNPSTVQRARKLGIPEEHCALGLSSKPESVIALQKKLGASAKQTLIIGDDYLDAEVKLKGVVDLFACPSSAVFYLQPNADIIIPRAGGDGAFRLLLDLMLYVQGTHFAQSLITHALL